MMRGRRDQPNDEASAPGPKPWEQEDGGSFGSWLRQQREIRNISLREISDNTKIGMRYLEALEEDRFEVLPAPIFAKGFLREYAKYVGLDADEVVNFYIAADQRRRAELDETDTAAPRPQVRPQGSHVGGPMPQRLKIPRLPLSWIVGGLVAMLLVALLVTWLVRRAGSEEPREEPPPAPPIAAPVVEPVPAMPGQVPAAAPAAVPADTMLVNLSFTAECWVEAVIDGSQRISELRVQGESMQIRARESVLLTLGNAGSVRVEVNGRPVQLGGEPGQVVRDLVIDRSTAGLPPLPAATPAPGGG
jgi:cytoskeletal protein RodZ